jgi:hypothetical protein
MTHTTITPEIRRQISVAKIQPETSDDHKRIYAIIKKIFQHGNVYYYLSYHDDLKGTLYYEFLIDAKIVLSFQLEVDDFDCLPREVSIISLHEYRKTCRNWKDVLKLKLKIEASKKDLSELGLKKRF